jgi:hypothetical protein
MRKSLVTPVALALGLLPLAAGQAIAAAKHSTVKTVTVAMHDPGCHWFSAGGKFAKTLSIKGPVALANYDEATLKVAGPSGLKLDPVGGKVVLHAGTYKITMVHQASGDNTLKLVVK